MVKKIVLVSLISFLSFIAHASDIIEYRDLDLMDLFDTAKSLQPTSENYVLPVLPVKVINKKGTRVSFNIGEKVYWVEGSEVVLSDSVKVKNTCNQTQVSSTSENKHYGIRGAGISCKN